MVLWQQTARFKESPWAEPGIGRGRQAVVLIASISLVLFGAIGSRLAYLQLVKGQEHQQMADSNRIRLIPKPPDRGRIFDRQGRLLAGSRLSYSVFLWPIAQRPQDWQKSLTTLAQLLDIPEKEMKNRLEQAGYYSPYLLRLARGIGPAQITALMEHSDTLPGVILNAEPIRYYPQGELLSHVLGYTGEISEKELAARQPENYRIGDVIGQMGIESALESRLRGTWGGQQVEVDARGQVLRILGKKPSVAGQDVTLTLDLDLQKAAAKALGTRRGAVVAIDPRDGAVRALVSYPGFDPNIFSGRVTPHQWQELQRRSFPFVNRALQGYPPASTFKIITTTAALESGRFSPNTVLATFPFLTVGGIQFWDWNRAGFGPLDFTGAMAWSSDTFFYQIALGVKEQPIAEWSRRYGFGEKTGLELAAEEAKGLVPDEAWKLKNLQEPWYAGDTVNMSIGQGFMQTSPLQVAVMFAVVANGGDRVRPHLYQTAGDSPSQWRTSIGLKPVTVDILKRGLRQVVTGGTGGKLNVSHLPPIAGKSGTAEDPPRQSHTWFGAYAPADKPELVVVAFGENSGGGGGSLTGPMTLQVLEAYFAQQKKQGRR
ncbi:Penicillin-binding Protein dimerization domain family [Gloeomargarita lithophora Alchichica-D10]|uniref:Penicillin-binding Protein dimerization domain family n=1 Tax=Gloeomargarita lithophora Alchichica-D10 TaxID=1188229 RepID=A0A1J0AAR9_9CYAN|nr:penicillin-binding protein 2 [Gloeomargarita lithophora]APB33026.1 Penicillin-binding Protein dimerization domain family [Gloeomargarita lithophora Alchichica-D10]